MKEHSSTNDSQQQLQQKNTIRILIVSSSLFFELTVVLGRRHSISQPAQRYVRCVTPFFDLNPKIMNWNILVGALLIFGSLKEMASIIINYRSGKLEFWPFGADLGCIALVVAGIYLVRKGQKQKTQL